MANGDCPVGARNAARLDNLERSVNEIKTDHHEVRDCVQRLLTDAAVRTAELDASSKAAVAWIAGGFTLVGVIANVVIALVAR